MENFLGSPKYNAKQWAIIAKQKKLPTLHYRAVVGLVEILAKISTFHQTGVPSECHKKLCMSKI